METSEAQQFMESFHDKNTDVVRDKGEFVEMLNNTGSCSWGWTEPEKYKGHVFVWLCYSPETKDDRPTVFYDYMAVEEYNKLNLN